VHVGCKCITLENRQYEVNACSHMKTTCTGSLLELGVTKDVREPASSYYISWCSSGLWWDYSKRRLLGL